MSAWQLGLFDVLAGDTDAPTICTTAGWHTDFFGLDRRWAEFRDGTLHPCWVVTHLLTGYVICAYTGDEAAAKAFADKIEPIGNWDFVDPAGAKAMAPAMGKIFRSDDQVINPAQLLPALWIRKKEAA